MNKNKETQIERLRDTFSVRLDAAVMARFPEADCETFFNIFSMQMQARWWKRGTDDEKLSPHKARLVREFVRGFSACEESTINELSKEAKS